MTTIEPEDTNPYEAAPIDRIALRSMFEKLMDEAENQNGQFNPDAFWEFCALLGQGRGITDRLRAGGYEAIDRFNFATAAGDAPGVAYQLGILQQLLLDIGRGKGKPSPFPKDFAWTTLYHDIGTMLGGPTAEGTGTPQLLRSKGNGRGPLRDAAVAILVGTVHFRSVREGRSADSVRVELLPDLSRGTWFGWLSEFKASAESAIAAAESGHPSEEFGKTDDELRLIIAAARRDFKEVDESRAKAKAEQIAAMRAIATAETKK